MVAKSIPSRLLDKLYSIPHTSFPYTFMPYLSASATLRSGLVEPCVVFFGELAYHRLWGPSRQRRMVDIVNVVEVSQSSYQLLPEFAAKLYEGGEGTMGGTYFSISMKDGSTFYYSLGGILDFVSYPEGYGMHDVSEVRKGIPFQTRMKLVSKLLGQPGYAWCLFKEPDDIAKRIRKESPRF